MAYNGSGNYSKIEQEGHRDEILKMVIDNVPYKDIAAKFGYSKDTVARYVKDKLKREAAIERSKNRKKLTADFSRTMEYLQGLNEKVIEACREWLQKPHSTKFTLEPRADEISVVYKRRYFDEATETYKEVREEATLQELIRIIEDEKFGSNNDSKNEDGEEKSNLPPIEKRKPVTLRWKIADPRKLILDALSEARSQIELIAKVTGELNDLSNKTDIYGTVVPLIVKAIIDETRGDSELRKKLISAIEGNLAIAEEEATR